MNRIVFFEANTLKKIVFKIKIDSKNMKIK